MSDFSMERLEPASGTTAVQGQPTPQDGSPRPRRRPVPRPRPTAAEPPRNAEDPSHQIDSLA